MPNNNRLQLVWAGLARNNRWSALITQADIDTFARRCEAEGAEFFARNLGLFRSTTLTAIGKGEIGAIPGFGPKRNSILPRFLYLAMRGIFADDGRVLDVINVDAVACVNQLTAVFTKIKGGHTPKSEVDVIESFCKTEDEIATTSIDYDMPIPYYYTNKGLNSTEVIRSYRSLGSIMDEASRLVKLVLSGSDPREIQPKHGSGVSACGTEVRHRFAAPRYVEKIDAIWSMSEYYYVGTNAFCDGLHEYLEAEDLDPCAKVLLVPKDARGPRLISCEPRETMWIQQGVMTEFYTVIQEHPLTRGRVNFTHQWYNQIAAYQGSRTYVAPSSNPWAMSEDTVDGITDNSADRICQDAETHLANRLVLLARQNETRDYLKHAKGLNTSYACSEAGQLASLDLKDASDRLRLDVVTRIFPTNWGAALVACRSGSTELPDGRTVTMRKHAPMGSATCFPVMALTIWSLLTAIAPRTARKSILVYGDDIIVPSFMAADATQVLEAVGLRVNVSKSFSSGPFRESCGEEFINGVRVTPVRLRMNLDDDNESLMSAMAFNNNMLETPSLVDNGWFLELLTTWYGRKRVPIAYRPLRKKVSWLDHVQQLKVGGSFRRVTLSGVAFTDDPSRVNLPNGKGTRLHGRYAHAGKPAYGTRQYSIVVPLPDVVQYDTGDWCHVLRSLTEKSNRELGLDPIHNRVRFKRRWVTLD